MISLGTVVKAREPNERGKIRRGLVTWHRGQGLRQLGMIIPPDAATVVEMDPGITHVTDHPDDDWEPVPPTETTAYERVVAANATWTPPDWLAENEQPADCDTYPWRLVEALLPPVDTDTDDMPTDTYECDVYRLVRAVAGLVDHGSRVLQDLDEADEWAETTGATGAEAEAWVAVRRAATLCLRLSDRIGTHDMMRTEFCHQFHDLQARLAALPALRRSGLGAQRDAWPK